MNVVTASSPARFRGLALILISPALVLGILATVALVRDRRAAQREAASSAREAAMAVASHLAQWIEPGANSGESLTPLGVGEGTPQRIVFEIGPTNELLSPAPLVWPPRVEPMQDLTSPVKQMEWKEAREAFVRGAWDDAIAAYDRFLDGDSDGVRHRDIARLERALSLERAGHTSGLMEAFESVLNGFSPASAASCTETGVPVCHLAVLRILELAGENPRACPPEWLQRPSAFMDFLGQSPPSPFLDAFLEKWRPRIDASREGPEVKDDASVFAVFDRNERARDFHAAITAQRTVGTPWPEAFWIAREDGHHLVARQSLPENATTAKTLNPRKYVVLPESWLVEALRKGMREVDRRGAFFVRVILAGRPVSMGNSADETTGHGIGHDKVTQKGPLLGELLATVVQSTPSGVAVEAGAGLADPTAFYASQRWRLRLFGGLLVAALVAALFSAWATQRALIRQYELNRQKSDFVSAVSHELRAPLGSIQLLAEGLERGTISGESRRQEYFQLIGQETRRLGALVENVLDFSRIEQGRKRYEFEFTDVPAMVRSSVRMIEPMAAARGIMIDLKPDRNSWAESEADGQALQQALLNLLENALKHSPSGATITVELSSAPDEPVPAWSLSVADCGPGIPLEEQRRIFEPFYRRGSELRRETPGVGIGLTIVQHILTAHGGRVDVESEVGQGAKFFLVWPARPHHPTGEQSPSQPS